MRRRVLVVALLGLVPALASAGEQANAPTATGETGYFTLFTGDTLPEHGLSFGLYYNNWDRIFKGGTALPPGISKKPAYDWDHIDASVGFGITDRWEASVAVPYDNFHGFDTRRTGGIDYKASGQGPVRIGTKLRLFGDRDSDTTFAINGFVELPTSNEIKNAVSDSTGYGGGLDWRIHNWVINAGYWDNGGNDGAILGPKAATAGIGYAGRVGSRLDWITEVVGNFYSGGRALQLKDSYDFTTGGRLWLGEDQNWALNFALRTDLNQLSSTGDHCPLGGLVGITYFPVFHKPAPPPPPPPPPAPEPPPAPAPPPPPPPPAPEPAPPPPPPAPAPKPEERVTVNFTPGSARLSNIAKAKLDEVALKMKQDPTLRAQVLGYTDPSGSASANQRISEQRAQAVKNYLVTRHGIDPSRITTEGRGSQDSTGDPAQDRRAVVILTVQ
jgi:outer membrane protein OmpA-like peptidoglycan-associated protein